MAENGENADDDDRRDVMRRRQWIHRKQHAAGQALDVLRGGDRKQPTVKVGDVAM